MFFFYNKENTSNIKRAGDEFFFFQEKIFHINGGKKIFLPVLQSRTFIIFTCSTHNKATENKKTTFFSKPKGF